MIYVTCNDEFLFICRLLFIFYLPAHCLSSLFIYCDLWCTNAEKQISFQVNWVNTQAFYSIGYWPFQLGITLFDTLGILSNWVFPQNKWLLVNNLRFNNFLCVSASIFVFITLIVSTYARHLNNWWVQTLVKTLVCLSVPGIFYSWVLFVLWWCLQPATETSLSILRTCSCLHDYWNGPLALCTNKWTISFTKSKAISILSVTKSF